MTVVKPIKVVGLRDFQAALKDLDGESQKLLRVTLNEVAETVAAGARRRMPSKTGRARASVKTASSQREVRVREGSKKTPYVPWLDFGGRVGPNRSVSRPFIAGGRYLYPTLAANYDTIARQLDEGLTALARKAGFEVT